MTRNEYRMHGNNRNIRVDHGQLRNDKFIETIYLEKELIAKTKVKG